MKHFGLALLAFVATAEASSAATYLFTLDNQTKSDVAKFYARGGEIEGSTRVRSGTKVQVKVTVPDKKCRTEFHIDFESPYYRDDDKVVDLCRYGGLTIG